MDEYRIELIDKDDNTTIRELENIRKVAFNLKQKVDSHYLKEIRNERIIPFAFMKEDEIIGGCYLGEYMNSLYVYFLFLKEEYKKNGLKIGRKLLIKTLEHKEEVEQLLNKSFYFSSLHSTSEKLNDVYESIGYKHKKDSYFVKRI